MFGGLEEMQVNVSVYELLSLKYFMIEFCSYLREIMPFTLVNERKPQVGRNKMVFPLLSGNKHLFSLSGFYPCCYDR